MSKQAIEGKRLNMFGLAPEDLILVTDESHPLYDERVHMPVSEAMVLNVMAKGVIEPIVVRKDGENALVVDGRQRCKAAVEANRRFAARGEPTIQVPVVIRKGDDVDAAEVMVSLNEIRKDDNPMIRARKAARLVQLGRSEAQIAIVFGVQEITIKNWLKLIDCSPAVQAAVEAGTFAATAAAKLSALPRAEQDAALTEETATKDEIATEADAPGIVSDGDEPAKPARVAGPKRTTSGAVSKAAMRKIYERASSPANEEFENALTDGERLVLGWVLGKVTTEKLGRECPGIYLLLGMERPGAATPDEAPEAEVFDASDEVPDLATDLSEIAALEEAA